MTELKRYILKGEFLNEDKYDTLIQESQRYEQLFQKWMHSILACYRGTRNASVFLGVVKPEMEGNQNLIFEGISSFIHSVIEVNQEHLAFEEEELEKSKASPIISWNQKIKKMVRNLKEMIMEQKKTERQLEFISGKIGSKQTQTLQNLDKQCLMFELNLVQKYLNLREKHKKILATEEQIFEASSQIEDNLFQFRKKIIDFKYGYLKKGVKLSRKIMECLWEYLSIGTLILKKLDHKLKGQKRSSYRSASIASSQGFVEEISESYFKGNRGYLEMLQNLKNIFLCNIPSDQKELSKALKQSYYGNEQNVNEMIETLKLFTLLYEQKNMFVTKIDEIIKMIHEQNSQARMSLDIRMALAKKKENRYSGKSNRDSKNFSESFIEKQLGVDKIEASIKRLIQIIIQGFENLGEECLKIRKKALEPRKNVSNFSISMEFKEIKIRNRRPSKSESWLWRDWRDFTYEPTSSFEINEEKLAQLRARESFLSEILDPNSVDSYHCSCFIDSNEQIKAKLFIFDNKLKIKTKKKKQRIEIIIPLEEIEAYKEYKKKIIIQLKSKQKLILKEFKEFDATFQKISQVLNEFQGNKNPEIESKSRPVLSEEEKKAISQRRDKIEKQLQDLQDYQKYGERIIKGCTMQDVYEEIFSDLGKCSLYKESFFSYMAVKCKNKNYSETKYNEPGPSFFVEDSPVNFTNCPLFSTKQSELDHTLPPIPFLPKECHCKENAKIFWISDKELDFKTEVSSSGASMMESFLTIFLYRIRQKDGNVSIEVYGKTVFIKETRLKSILASGAQGEMKQLIPVILQEIQRCMNIALKRKAKMISGNKKQENQMLENLENSICKSDKSVKKQKNSESLLSNSIFAIAAAAIFLSILVIKLIA